jgi:uncharacterized membrane protein YbhN (UPF0104 family)
LVIVLTVIATAVFTLRNLSEETKQLDAVSRGQSLLLAAALLLMVTSVICLGAVWALMLRWLSPEGARFSSLLRFFLYTWPSRYVPGTVPYHAVRVLFAERLGTRQVVVAASIAYEAILQVGTAATVGMLGVFVAIAMAGGSPGVYVLVILPLAALPITLQRHVLVPVANRLLRLVGKQPLPADAPLTNSQTATAFGAYSSIHLVNGIAFYLVIACLGNVSISPALAVGAYSLAGAAGVAVLFLPGGIGVREAVIVALLSPSMPAQDAIIAAAVTRALSVLADLGPLAILGSIDLYRSVLRLSKQTLHREMSTIATVDTLTDSEMRVPR